MTLSCLSVQADIEIKEAYVRGLPPGQTTTAAFMRLFNTAKQAVEIVSVSTDSAKHAEIHEHLHRDGMMRMEKVKHFIVPAGGDVVLEPGGYHLMLLDLHKPLREGDIVKIQLVAKNGERISAQLPVRSVLNEHKHQHH
ncbi:MAG: copper chaperone PCu(A)C [Spongiibacteraceae bacterium]|nr:copper chaperone PCu(A)C [Spongiibacteraceae bacterium]